VSLLAQNISATDVAFLGGVIEWNVKRRPVTGGQCSEGMPHCQEQCRAVTRHCWRFQSICQIEVRFGKCGKPVPLGRLDIRLLFAIIFAHG